MPFTQANRALRVTTPLGPDKLLISQFTGTERISELFKFDLGLLAENATKVEFDKLMGQKVLVELDMPGKKKRFFHGIVSRFSEGRRDDTFTQYKMEVVPQFWLLTRRVQSRIFQHITVPNILKEVLKGLDVKWDIKGSFFERDYCVQYRESDFAFASRMMQEEGIYYYFEHTAKGHTLVVANTPQGHADLPEFPKVLFEESAGSSREDMRIIDWEKIQELRSGKVTLWDHCFELPQKNLEAQKTIQETVPVGKVTHKLKVADNDKLELYDYPGAYAQRFDGIDPGGAARPDDLKKIFEDNARVAKLHIEREAAASLEIRGTSDCRQFTTGHKFSFERHFNGDGAYVLTSVIHSAKLGADYRSGDGDTITYSNKFTCIPLALPFRPQLTTPKPVMGGTQTATVVGPPGEAIFCDKYGRVKVQFHWDRQGKKDAMSSCWIRVSQAWGGGTWGGMTIPHVGQEVIVDFNEGDADNPLIVGRVYNAECMPPLTLPGHKTKSILRDHGGNQICMEGDDGGQAIIISSPVAGTTFSMGSLAPSIKPIGAGNGEENAQQAETPPRSTVHPLAPVLHEDGTFTVPDRESAWFMVQPGAACPVGNGLGSGSGGQHPAAGVAQPDGSIEFPNGDVKFPDGRTRHKDGSISLPDSVTTLPGFNAETAESMTHKVGNHVHWDVNVNETKYIKGYKETFILGHKTDVVQGYEKKHIKGDSTSKIDGHKSETVIGKNTPKTFGAKQEFVTPWESKEVVGFSTTVIAGNKNELIGGFAFKKHVGFKRETGPANLTTANERLEDCKKKLELEDQLIHKIKGICDQKIGTLHQEVKALTQKVDGIMRINAGEIGYAVDDLFKVEAGEYMAGIKDVFKLVAANFKISSEVNANDGALSVSK